MPRERLESNARYIYDAEQEVLADPGPTLELAAQAAVLLAEPADGASFAEGFKSAREGVTAQASKLINDLAQIREKGVQPGQRAAIAARFATEGADVIRAALAVIPLYDRISERLEDDTEDQNNLGPVAQLFYDAAPDGGRAIMKYEILRELHMTETAQTIDAFAGTLFIGKKFDEATKQQLFDEINQLPKHTTRHNVEVLIRLRRDGKLSQIDPEHRGTALEIIDLYRQWQERRRAAAQRFIYRDILPRQTPDLGETTDTTLTDQEIAALLSSYVTLVERHAVIVGPYRPTNRQMEKQGLRPTTTTLLRAMRNPQHALTRPENTTLQEEPAYVKRITGTLDRLRLLGAQPAEAQPESIAALVPAELVTHQHIAALYTQLTEAQQEVELPASLDADITWISEGWDDIKTIVREQWPGNDRTTVIPAIENALRLYQAAHRHYEQDPRNRLYAMARHIGSAALPPESKPQVESRRSIWRVDPGAARQGLESAMMALKDQQTWQRAGVIMHFLAAAESAARTQGQRAEEGTYGLYYADNAQDGRDRYFIVRYQDEQGRDWFVLETLESERATYIIAVDALRLLHESPFTDSADELQAALDYTKTEAREMGELVNVQARVVHQEDWTAESHVNKIKARMVGLSL